MIDFPTMEVADNWYWGQWALGMMGIGDNGHQGEWTSGEMGIADKGVADDWAAVDRVADDGSANNGTTHTECR